ncbi:hypothetical protein SEMRO_1697_G291880.1 [Seminavis robusta]|uniref:Uncharacterized protein n=1 Tax=Seminavis robusta TaxID=568900 RepID=A0A9N8EU53_9STRA|nr:hypothetical protein SEMRO_1697_G291880.1 [Seminavis robusta]|eukprot:Sro1697_g291880.1 n/a (254) ;mRNA; f:9195-9956
MSSTAKKEKWRNGEAKRILRMHILAGSINEGTDLDDLHGRHPEYLKWPIAQFKRNTKALLKSCKDKPNKALEKWGKSEAKALLKNDILDGTVTQESDAREVHNSRIEYKQYPFDNFKTNMGNLIELVHKEYDRMRTDCEAYGHDMAIVADLHSNNPPIPTPWHKSAAKKLLEKDIEEDKHLLPNGDKLMPIVLYKSRVEYREFKLKKFRGHLYQYLDKREKAKNAHRYNKKKTRGKAPATIVHNAPTRTNNES